MKVVPEEISAVHPSVTIEYSEIGGLFPISDVFWLGKVEYDGHSVLIVLSDWSLVSGGGVGANGPVAVFGVLGRFEIGDGSEYFGDGGMLVLVCSNSPFFNIESLGLYEYLLPYNLINLLGGRLGFRAGLILVTILYI